MSFKGYLQHAFGWFVVGVVAYGVLSPNTDIPLLMRILLGLLGFLNGLGWLNLFRLEQKHNKQNKN